MNTELTMTQPKPWFKQFWPWVLIGIPGLTVVACSITIYLAIVSQDGLVQDDYYKEGLAINQTLAKDHKARELGLSAYARVSDTKAEVFFNHADIKGQLYLRLLHPTRANQDLNLTLKSTGSGVFTADLPAIGAGKWHVELYDESQEWRIRGRMSYPASREVKLNAG